MRLKRCSFVVPLAFTKLLSMSLCFHCLQFCSLPLHSSLALLALGNRYSHGFGKKSQNHAFRYCPLVDTFLAPPQGRASGVWLKKPNPRPPKAFAEKAKSRRAHVRCPLRVQSAPVARASMANGGDRPDSSLLVVPPFGRMCSAGAPAGCGCSFVFLPTRAKNTCSQSALFPF